MTQTKREKAIQASLKRKHKVGDTVLTFNGSHLIRTKVTDVEKIKPNQNKKGFTFVRTDSGISGGVEHFIKHTPKITSYRRVEKGIIIPKEPSVDEIMNTKGNLNPKQKQLIKEWVNDNRKELEAIQKRRNVSIDDLPTEDWVKIKDLNDFGDFQLQTAELITKTLKEK